MKRVVITHGPGFEPIDEARRITNISSGRLGTIIAEKFAQNGHQVHAFRGTLATFRPASSPVLTIPFSTNDDLIDQLNSFQEPNEVDFVFHAAALCDYKVSKITLGTGEEVQENKIRSSEGKISLILEPSIKVLPRLQSIFSKARIVGWKYELNGDRKNALAAGLKQITGVQSAACVVNGKAYGEGFGFLYPSGKTNHLINLDQLADWLVSWTHSEHYNHVNDK